MSLSKNSPTSRIRHKLRIVSGGAGQASDSAWHTVVMPKLRELMGVDAFISWGAKLDLVHLAADKVVVSVPTPLMQRWLTDNHHGQMLEACQLILPAATQVEVVLRSFRPPLGQATPAQEIRLTWPTYGENIPTLYDDDVVPEGPQLLPDVRARVKVGDVQRLVMQAYGFKTVGAMLGKRGKEAFAMHLAMYACMIYTLRTSTEIGVEFGGVEGRQVARHAEKIQRLLAEKKLDKKAVKTLRALDIQLTAPQDY